MHAMDAAKNAIPYYRDFVIKPSIEWLPVFFRTLSALVIAPIVFFTILDITAYLIARTIGITAPHSSRTPSQKTIPLPPKTDITTPTIVVSATSPDAIKSPLSTSPSSTSEIPFPHHFTSSDQANLALAGEGVFSPPESRANTPPLDSAGASLKTKYTTRKRAASVGVEALGLITDDEDDGQTGSSGRGETDGRATSDAGNRQTANSLRKRNPAL